MKIVWNEGDPFDFYGMFPHHEENAMFEELRRRLLEDMRKPSQAGGIGRLKSWIASEYPDGVHRCDVPRVISRAMWQGVDLREAEKAFEDAYAGHCDWRTWWRQIERRGGIRR